MRKYRAIELIEVTEEGPKTVGYELYLEDGERLKARFSFPPLPKTPPKMKQKCPEFRFCFFPATPLAEKQNK
jgi:hypothetical protein